MKKVNTSNIARYLEYGISEVFNRYDGDGRFDCQASVVDCGDVFKCFVTMGEYEPFGLADVTAYLRKMKSTETMIAMLDLFIPNICGRLMGQLAQKALYDENFKKYSGLVAVAKQMNTI